MQRLQRAKLNSGPDNRNAMPRDYTRSGIGELHSRGTAHMADDGSPGASADWLSFSLRFSAPLSFFIT
jgi:hypothetical protein